MRRQGTCDVAGLKGGEDGAAVPVLGHDIPRQLHELATVVGVHSVKVPVVITARIVVTPHP